MQLVEVRATTDLDDDYRPIRTPLDPAGTTEVLSTSSFVVRFDRFVLPSTAIRQAICIHSDLNATVRSFEDCTNGVALEPAYHPARREVLFRQRPDQPRLSPGTRYVLTVLAPASEGAPTGFRAFDQAPLATSTRIEFSTVMQDPPQASVELPPAGDLYCRRDPECLAGCGDDDCRRACDQIGVARLITDCSRGGGCHGSGTGRDNVLRGAAAGLDFSTAELILATAVNRVAHQTQVGEHADEPERSPLRFGRAMPILDAQNPGNSYAMYKLAVGSYAAESAASAEEIARLRASVVVGLPMPVFDSSAYGLTDLDALSDWIAQGAVPRDCSLPPFE